MGSGTEFTLSGHSIMYRLAALGKQGGLHTISLLKTQLQQLMEQIGCEKISDFPTHLVKK